MAYRSWTSKIQCLRKLEYYTRSIKNDILNRKVRLLKSMFISMHSILGWASFCMNYCINAAWHGGNQPVALLRCNGSPGCFDSGLQIIWVWCLSSSSWQYPIDSLRFKSGEFAGQSSTVTLWSLNQLLVHLAVWAGAKSCWKMKSASSIKLVSRRKHEVLKNFLVDGCVDCGLQKTQWTNTSRWHGSPNHHWLWKLHTELQAMLILWLSTLPPDSGTLISKWNTKCTFIWKEDFGPLSNSPVLFSLAQVRCFWRCFCGLVALFLKMSERGDSWCTDSSFSSLLVKLSQVFESALLDSILKIVVIPVACANFPTQFLPSSQLCI